MQRMAPHSAPTWPGKGLQLAELPDTTMTTVSLTLAITTLSHFCFDHLVHVRLITIQCILDSWCTVT